MSKRMRLSKYSKRFQLQKYTWSNNSSRDSESALYGPDFYNCLWRNITLWDNKEQVWVNEYKCTYHWLTKLLMFTSLSFNNNPFRVMYLKGKENEALIGFFVSNCHEYCCFISCFLYILIRFRSRKRLKKVIQERNKVLFELDKHKVLLQDLTKIVASYLDMSLLFE